MTRDMKEPRGHEGRAGSSVPLFPGGEEGLKFRTPSDTIVSRLNMGTGKNLWAVHQRQHVRMLSLRKWTEGLDPNSWMNKTGFTLPAIIQS